MRRLIAALAVVSLALGFTTVLIAPAQAALTSPAAGAVLRGSATIADSGGYDDSTLDHCSWFGGAGGSTRLQLINSGGTILINEFWNTGGARSHTFDTHSFPNGTYTVRGIIEIRRNSGFGGFGCKTDTETSNRTVTIDNISAIAYGGPSGAPRNTTVSVSATLTDPNRTPQGLNGQTVTFSLSGGGSVTGTTDANGVATANLPVTGNARTASLSASFAQTTFWKGSSVSVPFTVAKNSTATTLDQPAPVVHGQATSFSASVALTNGTGLPTGDVQFTVDGAAFGAPVPLVGGMAGSQSTTTLSTGSHTIGADFLGDGPSGNFSASSASAKTQVVNKADTTTVLTSDITPTVSGQTVTFTAEVDVAAPGVGTPTGGVQFNVDGQPFGTAVPLTGDTATLAISNLSTGNHAIDATYNGNTDFASSSSAVLTHGVNKAEASLDLTTSVASAVAGEPLTFTADVTAVAPGAGTPTGTVQFAVDGTNLGAPVALSGGTATSPSANLDAGSHLITADYTGDNNFGGAQDSLIQVVAAAQTTTTVSTSPNPSVVGQSVTLHAEVTPVSPATGTPAGAAQFYVDGNSVGFVALTNGEADLTISTLSVGSHTVTATYASTDANFVTSTSDPVEQQVNKAATKVVLASSASPSVYGQPVTFTATVSVLAPGAGAPAGTITFTDGSTVLGTQPVSSGTGFQASVTTSSLSVAQHAITATYSGDDSFLGSSGNVLQKVNRAQTSTLLTSSANPAQNGQGVSFTATVSPVAPGAGMPTGTVRFQVRGVNLGAPATLVNGVATSTSFASLTPGNYAIKAIYNGDGNFVGSEGTLDQGAGLTVTKGETSMTLDSGDPASDFAQPVTFTATVKAVAPATGKPSGVVQFWEGSVLLGSISLSPTATANTSKAEFVSSTLTPGSHSIRSVYVGNFNFNGQTASTSQSVDRVPTVTGIESSENPATFGDSVTLTATVTPTLAAPGVPTGTVTFTEGPNVLGTAPVSNVQGLRQASLTVPGLSAGTHSIKATYSGDGTYGTSTSLALDQVISRAASHLEAEVMYTEQGGNAGMARATLTGNDGAPLAGETLVFTTTQHNTDGNVIFICSVVTDSNGFAGCDATALYGAITLNGGYDVDFAGNSNYLPATDHGSAFRQ